MEITTNASNTVPFVSWKTVATQKMERLQELVEGEPVREVIEITKPKIYVAKDGRVEVIELATSQTIDLMA
jgi:hypothetical protein|tara:strand:- start:1314 stop:1526 length:213 start_codon:yes stop_codon:yes gene_type:complete